MNPRILVVEDQTDIGQLIALNLESLNYSVTHKDDGALGMAAAQSDEHELLILDIMLPHMDGLAICQQLRQQGDKRPILMLTAKKSEADRVVGLEVGADDYLTKPFSVRELQARVKALLRRVSFNDTLEEDDTCLKFGTLKIEAQRRSVKLQGKSVKLTAKEFDLLFYMASHPGQVFTREQLLNAVWGSQHDAYQHTVNSHINRLRAKLNLDPDSEPSTWVHTVWGVGYKFDV